MPRPAKPIVNVAASVRDRLMNVARQTHRPFADVLLQHAIERFLYRLSQSPFRNQFVLKGALSLVAAGAPFARPTRDIDVLGFGLSTVSHMEDIVRQICTAAVEADGLQFDPRSVHGRTIKEGADYEGVRVSFLGFVGTARVSMQMDIGFGDVVTPAAETLSFPSLLGFPEPALRTYPRYTIVAEKLEAVVKLGLANTRMKDYCDLHMLSRQFDFDGQILRRAIAATFAHRITALPTDTPVGLRVDFARDNVKQMQWRAFLDKGNLTAATADLGKLVTDLRAFLVPPLNTAALGEPFDRAWHAGHWM